ncbi:hypothetical protein K443DRAFT_111228 [Laccaria amethystina LaAM-08-1]|uniref:Unplaced genomic scaffold K443scaffold_279, whole genome shotgun sequence n=1 Tax=Laccaria amethystina LaAM-08-1 TaxID=1095629 RepID=A0A0C9WRG1_9AGAR|nr:hypothetical protein K443DRAFT_111228 [Laccaria amethystina LaAM-08-1]
MRKWKRQVKWNDVLMKGTENDIVVPVMGATGVGKSTFINNFMGKNAVVVGHDLKSCTAQLTPVISPITVPAHLQGKRLILVDTPGFDDTYTSDSEILRRIAIWLASSYDSKMKLGGIIYLHNISQPRMLGSDRQNLAVFQDLCGNKALSSVIIGITKSGDIPQEVSEKRCNELSSTYWKEMINAGATVHPLGNDATSAQKLLTIILENIKLSKSPSEPRNEFVEIQKEVVDQAKLVSETKAGKQLKSTLKEVLEMQKKLALQAENDAERRKEHSDNVNKLDVQINALKVPFSRRLLAAFGLVSALVLKKSLLICL